MILPPTNERRLRAAPTSGGFRHLREFQFHGRCAPENRDRHLEALALIINFFDHAIEIFKRPVINLNLFTNIKGDGRAGAGLALFNTV